MARSSLPGVNTLGELKLLQLVGQGTFGQVYKALWRRRCVAVKVLQLPATVGNSDASPWAGVARVSSHREKMAVMETVVSTTMSHPNIVQVSAGAPSSYMLAVICLAEGGYSCIGSKVCCA
jgi:serine/threonine protein kinase